MNKDEKNNNEKGFILPSVLLISLLIISLLLSIITVVWFNHTLEIKRINKKKLDLACHSAVQLHLISNQNDYTEGSYFAKIDSLKVFVEHRLQGLYYFVSAKSFNGKDSSKVHYMFARDSTEEFQNALIFSRPDITPVTVGNTKIEGNIMMNSNRITKGNIFGINNSLENYLNGDIKTSSIIKIKLLSESFIRDIFNKTPSSVALSKDMYTITPDQIDTSQDLNISGDITIRGSSTIPNNYHLHRIFVNGNVNIENGTFLNMDIEIYCDSIVVIGAGCKLQNTLIASKSKITIEDNCELKDIQLFSKKGIEINNSLIKYPAILCLYVDTKDKSNYANKLALKSSIVNGSVILVTDNTGLSDNKSKIVVDEKSRVQGIVYSENNAEIAGSIIGSVYVYNLWYYKDPTEYINWMVNLHIDRKGLASSFLTPVGFNDTKPYKLLEETWEY